MLFINHEIIFRNTVILQRLLFSRFEKKFHTAKEDEPSISVLETTTINKCRTQKHICRPPQIFQTQTLDPISNWQSNLKSH